MSHWKAIGFDMSGSEFQRLIRRVSKDGTFYDTPAGTYLRWSPGVGVELWIQANLEREIIGCNPHFCGEGVMRIAVTESFHSLTSNLEGRFVGWAEPKDEKNPSTGLFVMTAEMPDFTLSEPSLFKNPLVSFQIAGFAEEIAHFPTEKAFATSVFARTMSVPTFQQSLETDEDGSVSLAALTGYVRKSELRINPLTEQPFYVFLLETLGGTIDVVAPCDFFAELPEVDSILAGQFWLSARAQKRLSLPRPLLKQRAWV